MREIARLLEAEARGESAMIRQIARRAFRTIVPWLYSRSNFKLFLQRTIKAVDLRTAATMAASDVLTAFVRPIPVSAPFGRAMLVIAPHQDDEIIGCGGAILLQLQSGDRVTVVFTQDGGNEHQADGRSRTEQVAMREAESMRVCDALNLPRPTFLRLPTLRDAQYDLLVDRLAEELIRTTADAVFCPFVLDTNRDHQATVFAVADALRRVQSKARVLCYEVWGLVIPNVILRIDEVADRKFELLGMYVSQMAGRDYVHGIRGLNMYASLQYGSHCRYAERFFELPAAEFVAVVDSIRRRVGGTPTSPTHF